MPNLVQSRDCVGCHACESICKSEAICMTMDDEGFFYPQVDAAKCIECKACMNVCPALAEKTFDRLASPVVYAAWSNNSETRKISSSGGVFTELAIKMFANSGVVYGATFGRNFKLCHQGAESEAALAPLRGSKYVQSNLAGIFADVQTRIKRGQPALYVGTPCQIAGLYNFLGKDYQQVITCDLICHGVASPGVFAKYIRYLEEKHSATIVRFDFRAKPQGWREYFFDIQFDNGTSILKPFYQDPYMKGFLADLILRPSCYRCKYSRVPRTADLTLGDFWGIWNYCPEWYNDQGVSALLVNSLKGQKFVTGHPGLTLKTADLEWVVKGNPTLISSVTPHKNRKKFFNLYVDGMQFESNINKCLPPPTYIDKVLYSIKRRLKS